MTSPQLHLLSNLATGTFIQLEVAQDEDALQAARRELGQRQLTLQEQHGFFLSIYPTEPSEHDAEAYFGAPLTEDQSSVPVYATSDPGERSTGAAEDSPLDAAAAQGPLDWPDAESEAQPEASDQPDSVPPVVPVIGLGLGSAGGH